MKTMKSALKYLWASVVGEIVVQPYNPMDSIPSVCELVSALRIRQNNKILVCAWSKLQLDFLNQLDFNLIKATDISSLPDKLMKGSNPSLTYLNLAATSWYVDSEATLHIVSCKAINSMVKEQLLSKAMSGPCYVWSPAYSPNGYLHMTSLSRRSSEGTPVSTNYLTLADLIEGAESL